MTIPALGRVNVERLSAKGRGRSAPCSPQGEGTGGGQTYVHSWREGSSHVCVTGKPGRHPRSPAGGGVCGAVRGPDRRRPVLSAARAAGWAATAAHALARGTEVRPGHPLRPAMQLPPARQGARAPGLPQPLAELSRCRAKAGATHHHVSHAPRAAPPEGLVCPEFTLTSERFPANTPWLKCATASSDHRSCARQEAPCGTSKSAR